MNKRMVSFVVFFAAASMLLCGCQQQSYCYPFEQNLDYIEKVEICQYTYHIQDPEIVVLTILEKSTALSLLNRVEELECYRHWGDHTQDFGEKVVKITYTDGETEVLGFCNTAYIDMEGKWWLKGYYFDEDQFSKLISEFTQIDPVTH